MRLADSMLRSLVGVQYLWRSQGGGEWATAIRDTVLGVFRKLTAACIAAAVLAEATTAKVYQRMGSALAYLEDTATICLYAMLLYESQLLGVSFNTVAIWLSLKQGRLLRRSDLTMLLEIVRRCAALTASSNWLYRTCDLVTLQNYILGSQARTRMDAIHSQCGSEGK